MTFTVPGAAALGDVQVPVVLAGAVQALAIAAEELAEHHLPGSRGCPCCTRKWAMVVPMRRRVL